MNVRPDVQKIFRASVKARLQVVQDVADVLLMWYVAQDRKTQDRVQAEGVEAMAKLASAPAQSSAVPGSPVSLQLGVQPPAKLPKGTPADAGQTKKRLAK